MKPQPEKAMSVLLDISDSKIFFGVLCDKNPKNTTQAIDVGVGSKKEWKLPIYLFISFTIFDVGFIPCST